MNVIPAAVLAAALLATGCASMPKTSDAQGQLFRTDREWAAVASEGKDVDRVVSFWSDDATIAPPGAPLIVGKTAIRQFVAQSFATPGFRINWKTLQVTVSQDGTLGYTTGDSTLTFPGPDGKLMTMAGRGVTVWRRDSTGAWKCVYDTWNYGP